MILGLKRGTVALASHDPEWEKVASETIERLWSILGDVAKDVQHVGSTAITSIKAKPIIDIAVAVQDFDEVMALLPTLEEKGFIYRKRENHDDESLLFACGDYSNTGGIVTHFIHVVKIDSSEFINYINFRDYMNTHFTEAKAYETLKLRLMDENPIDPDREKYLAGKKNFIKEKLMLARLWNDFGRKFTHIESVNKGWSSDKKYYTKTVDDKQFLIRVADISQYEHKKAEYENMKRVAALGIPMQQPVDFGVCNDGKSVFLMLTWVEGDDAEEILPLLIETEQYALGIKAGKIIKEMQTIETLSPSDDWFNNYGAKIDRYIKNYRNCGLTFEGDEKLIAYIEQNRHIMKNQTMCLTHDDYHPGNLILNKDHELFVIDFQRLRMVEPYHALAGVQFSAKPSPHFATGQLNAYFEGEPPENFWRLLALYMACVAVNSLPWSIPFGQGEIDFAYRQIADILSWYDNMQSVVPTWYLKDFYIQYIDGIPYKLKSPFDFSFLSKYGNVFKVFDDQDSGNICFGVQNGDTKYFIKFAGAPTERANCTADTAIHNLSKSLAVYRDLSHDTLIKLIDDEEIGGGLAAIFEWVDAECMGKMYPLSRQKFMQMPLETRLKVFDEILVFHAHVAKQRYVAIDFYDGSIMYDFNKNKTVVCDIDFYTKAPYTNNMGRMWGSSLFMSPEEYKLGAVIDEITNVYAMGATAFSLFGDDSDRCIEKWKLSKELFEVAKKAVSDDRSERQQSIEQMIQEWNIAR